MSSRAVKALDYRPPLLVERMHRQKPCADHLLVWCPLCDEAQYMRRRVLKSVNCSLKRLGLQKTQPVLDYLGAETWEQVLELLAAKRSSWNLAHPQQKMTPTNTALDHIRPVRMFANASNGARVLLCNHYTNLQPLLHEDNAWKADCWSTADDDFWHKHIIMNNYKKIYYPEAAPAQPSLLFKEEPKM